MEGMRGCGMKKKKMVSGLTLLFQGEESEERQQKNCVSSRNNNIAPMGKPEKAITGRKKEKDTKNSFSMPLHYPNYTKEDYEKMPEWMIDNLLSAYGLPREGDLNSKKKFAIGAFVWPEVHVTYSPSPQES